MRMTVVPLFPFDLYILKLKKENEKEKRLKVYIVGACSTSWNALQGWIA